MLIIVIITQIFTLNKLLSYQKLFEDKNKKLIQLYLDMKFFCRILNNNLKMHDSHEFSSYLINEIKQYYSLEDIVIIDSLTAKQEENEKSLKTLITGFLKQNTSKITNKLQTEAFVEEKVKFDGNYYRLYLSSITPENYGLVVCIESEPHLLSKTEIVSLENAITLLKARMLHG